MCMECRQIPCHPQCPNYSPPRASEYCDICNEGIYEDEEYIENENGDVMHYDCCSDLTMRELVQWLGCEIRRMKDYD